MAESILKIYLAIDNKVEEVSYTQSSTAEDICIFLCRKLGIGTIARHLFALRLHGKQIFLMPSANFEKGKEYDLRIRFKVASTKKLKKIDIKAYDYYFHQARNDVLENKIPDLIFEKYRKELVGLGITDMYRVMLEKEILQETVENDYKKYIPKEVLKRHSFFIKKPIHDTLSKIKKSGHDAWYVKAEYLRQLELMVSEYLAEEYKALTEQDGVISSLIVRVSPFAAEPGIKYCMDSKKDKWHCICALEDLGFISLRKDSTVEISRRNGIPFYLKFNNMHNMLSFVSLVDGYYRLSVKWTFNICKDVITPSLLKLYSMKCHGPVGGEFSYAKLEEKRGNKPGCFILRESDSKYNIFYIDVCVKDSSKPQTYKLEYVSDDEFIFHNDITRYKSVQQLMSAYNKEDSSIFLGECLPPSENEKSPLLLCQSDSLAGDSLIDSSTVESLHSSPRCINNKDLQIYKGKKCLKWNKKRAKAIINNEVISLNKFHKSLFPDESAAYAKRNCRNPDSDPGGPWCFVESANRKEVEKEYCDVPFCQSEVCTVLTKNYEKYTHFTRFPHSLTNFSFGVKLWHPDSYLNASVRLVLSLFALPLTREQIHSLGTGIEIYISNTQAGLTSGNTGSVEYEDITGLIKAYEFTYFSLTWWHNIVTLFVEGRKNPVFMADYKSKKTLMGYKMNQFYYYAARGTDVVWSFPFCDESEQCDVHITTGSDFLRFYPLRETSLGHDINLYLRAFRSAYIKLQISPVTEYPSIKIMFSRSDNYTRVEYKEHAKGATVTLRDTVSENLLKYWTWQEFTLGIFMNQLQVYVVKETTMFPILFVDHLVFKKMRWFSPGSENSIAQWSFFCFPPADAIPPPAYPPECALNRKEPMYNGTQDLTSNGIPCLPWASDGLIPVDEVNKLFNEKGKYQAWNYCRDPKDEQKGTFCYTISQDPDDADRPVKKEYCHIRKCKSAECKIAGTGNDYIGKESRTRSNRTCQHWVSPSLLKLLDTPLQDIINETATSENVHVRSLGFKKLEKGNYSEPELIKHLLDLRELFNEMNCTDTWKCLREIYGSDDLAVRSVDAEITEYSEALNSTTSGIVTEITSTDTTTFEIINNTEIVNGTDTTNSPAILLESLILTNTTVAIGSDLNINITSNLEILSTSEITTSSMTLYEPLISSNITATIDSDINTNSIDKSESSEISSRFSIPIEPTIPSNIDSVIDPELDSEVVTDSIINSTLVFDSEITANLNNTAIDSEMISDTTEYMNDTNLKLNASDLTAYQNLSRHPPHQKEILELAKNASEVKFFDTQIVDDEETQTSRYDYSYHHTVDKTLLNETFFAEMDLKKVKNYCRNPSRDLAGSWCYTEDPAVPIDVCNVRDCDKEEECIIFLNGDGRGRKIYILPQWKESGYHGGLRFSAKQWNPDLVTGLAFDFWPLTGFVNMRLEIGANDNERIILYYDSKKVKEKSMPHIISSGKWVSFWLQIRIGEIVFGFEGVPTPLFEWKHSNASNAMSPVYLLMSTINGYPLGMSLKCDECHTEITSTKVWSKIFPIGLWKEEQPLHRTLTLHVRGTGSILIPLYMMPSSDQFYSIGITDRGSLIFLYKHIYGLASTLKTTYTRVLNITESKWTTLEISFSEYRLNITSNGTLIMLYMSKIPMLFYWFSLGAEGGWITWSANCEPLDIDGDPLDGGWSKWSPWVCTVSCGGGSGYRTRTCSNPKPNIFGRLCEGSPTSTGACNHFQCGDVSPDTMGLIRESLRSNFTSLVVQEKQSVRIENNPIILSRIAVESPDAYYEWTLNGVFVNPEPRRVEFVGDDIVIRKAKPSDSGIYVCMFFRINKQRLVLQVVSLAVIPKKIQIDTRATRKVSLKSNAVVLAYVYTDLKQRWTLNDSTYSDYGTTTLAAVDYEDLSPVNESHTGEWRCIIEQSDLKFTWITNIARIRVKKPPNFFTNIMEDEATAPVFSWLKTETNVAIALVFIVVFVFGLVAFGLFAYFKWGRLPELTKNIYKVKNRRFEK